MLAWDLSSFFDLDIFSTSVHSTLLSSFVRVFLLHFNLTTYLKKDAFEINQGLFTKKSIVLKKQKVQNITISTNPLKRLIGVSFITFKQAVSGKLNTKKKDKLIRIVGCKKHQVETIKSSLFDFSKVENSAIHFPDAYYKRRIFMFSFLFLTLFFLYFPLFLVSLIIKWNSHIVRIHLSFGCGVLSGLGVRYVRSRKR